MLGEKWKIYWNNQASDTYLYGSEIVFHKKENVEFKNRLMPPGTIIKRWYSKTNYQAQRIEPSLPIIDGEESYLFQIKLSCDNPMQYLVRLVFYDRYGMEAGNIIVRGEEQVFKCPLKTYYYEVQLISSGISHFHFHAITITEYFEDDEEETS